MKKTGFARRIYERQPRPPVRPIVGCRGVYAPAANEPVVVPKDEPVRNRAYREWVTSHECFACSIVGWSQAAHSNSPKHGKAKGLKADDRFIFSLCSDRPGKMGCHTMHDTLIDMDREERRELEEQYVERMQLRAVAVGWMNEQRELIR